MPPLDIEFGWDAVCSRIRCNRSLVDPTDESAGGTPDDSRSSDFPCLYEPLESAWFIEACRIETERDDFESSSDDRREREEARFIA